MKGKEIFFDERGVGGEEYSDLLGFLLAYIFDRTWESPEEVAVRMAKNAQYSRLMNNVLQEGHQLLARPDFPWEYVRYAANYTSIENSEDATRNWLLRILRIIEVNLASN